MTLSVVALLVLTACAVSVVSGAFDVRIDRQWYCKRWSGDGWYKEMDRYYRAHEEVAGYIMANDKVNVWDHHPFEKSNGYLPFIMRPRNMLELWKCRLEDEWPGTWNLLLQCNRHWPEEVFYKFDGQYYSMEIKKVNATRTIVKRLSYGSDKPVVNGIMNEFHHNRYYVVTMRPDPEFYLCWYKGDAAEPKLKELIDEKTKKIEDGSEKAPEGEEEWDDGFVDPAESLWGTCIPDWIWIVAVVIEAVGLMIALSFCMYRKLMSYLTPDFRIEYTGLGAEDSTADDDELLKKKQQERDDGDGEAEEGQGYLEMISEQPEKEPVADLDLR